MRRFLPSLSALQAFDAAARQLSFTRAAEDLRLTQSGISRQIANLETHLGLRLFERTGSRLVLTDAGLSYAADVRQVLDRLEEVSIDAVRGRRADMGLTLGAHPTFALRFLMPRLRGFVDSFPDIPLEISTLPQNVDPGAIEADLAIIRGSGSWPGTRSRALFAERLVVVASPALVADLAPPGDGIDFRRLPTLQNASRPSLWLQWLHVSGMTHRGVIAGMRLPQGELLIAAVREGLGLAVLPLHYVVDELRSGAFVTPFGPPVPSGDSYWIITPEAKANGPHLLTVRDWLVREADAMSRMIAKLA